MAAPFAAVCAAHLSPWVRGIFDGGIWTVLQQDWRFAFFGPAGALFVVFLLFVLLQKNRPADVGLPAIEEYHDEPETILEKGDRPEEELEGTWELILKVLKNRNVLFLSLVYALLKPTRYLMILWGPLYINDKLGTGMVDSTILSTPFEIAGVIAILTAGYVSDKLFRSRRMPYSVICLFLLALTLFCFDGLISLTQSKVAVVSLLCAVGFLMYGPEALLSATAPLDFGTKKGASTASGMVNAVGSITSAVVSTFGAAWVIQRWSWNVLFIILACVTLVLVLLLLPKWNTVPLTADKSEDTV